MHGMLFRFHRGFFYGGKGNLVKQVRTQRPTDNIQCIFKKRLKFDIDKMGKKNH